MSGFVFGDVQATDATPAFSAAVNAGSGVTVATTSTSIVASNANRKLLVLCNGGAFDVWVTLAASGAAVGTGLYLKASGGSVSIAWSGAVCGINNGGGTAAVGIVEL